MNATKTQIKSIKTRIAVLTTELNDPYTIGLGKAAVKCVQESLDAWTTELAKIQA